MHLGGDWEELGADAQKSLGNVRTFCYNPEMLTENEYKGQILPQSIQ